MSKPPQGNRCVSRDTTPMRRKARELGYGQGIKGLVGLVAVQLAAEQLDHSDEEARREHRPSRAAGASN